MAGDWIKVEKATARKPEVLRIADLLSIPPDHAFGLCVRFWFWCDDNLTNGHALSVTNVTLESVVGHAGFASALLEVGWLAARNGSLQVPNFDRHLSESAKNRALSAERKRKERSRSDRDKSVTREEKRRDKETPTPLPACLDTEKFRTAWSEWKAHRLEIRKPLKPTQVRKQLEMLAEMGESRAVATIAHTIEKGWQGLREPDHAVKAAAPAPVVPPKPPPEVPHHIPKVKIT